ncbi:ABC transporter permease [Pseudobutyrivibrio xylanivorans]|uniref:ABC-2 type transport system permease protein n=1 Tax=Pseudobutyrivibrio xylanivorans TaxID=185007 RepID=A0A1G5RXR8_PSEXY|nr:ABC transporter permease subunit [Pseudobutyrivibrio xylanivorans]SCZ78902.1 ABC-2 type transport system permease protein [Pseudobutyrivibrio xylanivorans]
MLRNMATIIKKELIESIRKYRLFILMAVFIFIGFMSPIGTKYLGEIMSMLLPEGYEIKVRQASEVEAYFQFFKNISQLGMVVFIVVSSGLMADEFEKKTIVCLLTKGVSRSKIIISKFIAGALELLFCYITAVIIFRYYTGVFWSNQVEIATLLYSNLIVFEYGLLILGLNIFLGTKFGTKLATVTSCIFINILQILMSIHPTIAKYLPVSLLSNCVYIVEQKKTVSDTVVAVVISMLITILLLVISIKAFKEKEIEQ